jgi:hypothetical protein
MQLKLILAVSLFFNLVILSAPAVSIYALIRDMPPQLATLLAGILGLGMIAWQTKQGFNNLIAAQDHRAELERIARIEQAELAEVAKKTERQQAKDDFATSIIAEMNMLLFEVTSQIRAEYKMIENMNQLADSSPDGTMIFTKTYAPIFEKNLDKLGMLGSSLASEIVKAYRLLNLNNMPEKEVFFRLYKKQVLVRKAHAEHYLARMAHTAERIGLIQTGAEDPGDFEVSPRGKVWLQGA